MLAINAFVCSVISYSKVKQVVFESWFKTLQIEQKLGEQLAANFISSRDGPAKSTETRQGMLLNSSSFLLVSNAMYYHP